MKDSLSCYFKLYKLACCDIVKVPLRFFVFLCMCACVAWMYLYERKREREYGRVFARAAFSCCTRMWFTACDNARSFTSLNKYSSTFFYVAVSCLTALSLSPFIVTSFLHSVVFNAVTMFPRVILKGTMIKKSQQKKRTSPCNYKERFFVLDTQDLKYSECRPGVSMH